MTPAIPPMPVVMPAPIQGAQAAAQAAILSEMRKSAAGWNSGDLNRFMGVYASDARYVTANGVVAGRDAIAKRYAKSFAEGGNVRGRLRFAPLYWRSVDARHMLLTARWTLTPKAGKAQQGMTTLLFEKRDAGWRIVVDHSS